MRWCRQEAAHRVQTTDRIPELPTDSHFSDLSLIQGLFFRNRKKLSKNREKNRQQIQNFFSIPGFSMSQNMKKCFFREKFLTNNLWVHQSRFSSFFGKKVSQKLRIIGLPDIRVMSKSHKNRKKNVFHSYYIFPSHQAYVLH